MSTPLKINGKYLYQIMLSSEEREEIATVIGKDEANWTPEEKI